MSWTTSEDLQQIAGEKGYRPEILEKVYRLLDFIQELNAIDFLKNKLVLKGGTAINIFCADTLPRLSVDLDFNYIGSSERDRMLSDKLEIDGLITALCKKKQYDIYRNPRSHAGGKMVLTYNSAVRKRGRLEIDLNYLYRAPLWVPEWRYSADWLGRVGVSVLNIHELAAGKLHALLDRTASRDLFDSYRLLTQWPLDEIKLRQAFTVYAGMRKNGWREMQRDMVEVDIVDIRNRLFPVLQSDHIPGTKMQVIKQWADQLGVDCQEALKVVLPFNEQEIAFLTSLDEGVIKPELLSTDTNFCHAVISHPALRWRCLQNKTNTV